MKNKNLFCEDGCYRYQVNRDVGICLIRKGFDSYGMTGEHGGPVRIYHFFYRDKGEMEKVIRAANDCRRLLESNK